MGGNQYNDVGNIIKDRLMNGKLLMVTFSVLNTGAHVVTLWGAEYNLDGTLSAVYITDSDDVNTPAGDQNHAMVRYRVIPGPKNVALYTTDIHGKSGGEILGLNSFSLGQERWEEYLGIQKETLTLEWEDTNFVYNGMPQKPEVICLDELNADVEVFSTGAQTDAGSYRATAGIRGADAGKYQLPSNKTKAFTIRKANVDIAVNADLKDYQANNAVVLHADVSGVLDEKPDGTIAFLMRQTTRSAAHL